MAGALHPSWSSSASLDECAAWAVAWLQWHPGWLLIFDDVENFDDLRPYMTTLVGGHLVATSRKLEGSHHSVPTLTLGNLGLAESSDLLLSIALGGQDPTPEQRENAKILAVELGNLPLALVQAGAFIRETGMTFDAYRQSLGRVVESGHPRATIGRILELTLERIAAENPVAVKLLQSLAWVSPDNIPRDLIVELAGGTTHLGKMLAKLSVYGAVSLTGRGLDIHPLVQAQLRDQLKLETPPKGRPEAERALLHLVDTLRAGSLSGEPGWEHLIPHVIAFAENAPSGNDDSDEIASLYYEIAGFLTAQGEIGRTIPLLKASLTQRERTLGSTHPDTLSIRTQLAYAYRVTGQLGRAIPLLEATLAQSEQVLGSDHPDTLTSRNNLAYAYQAAGDLGRAIPLLEATLAQREQVLGSDHPDTLTSRNNLATAYLAVDESTRAVDLLKATLAQSEQVLGSDHPYTLTTRSNLAYAYQAAGDLGRAIPLLEATLTQREQIFGSDHPDTLTSRNNLAYAYQAAGDLGRAIPLLEATLTQSERVLGRDHPDTLTSRSNLAYAHSAAGDLGRAIPLLEATLTQSERVLGPDHPDTLTSRNNLAISYQAAGDLGRAIPLLEETLALRELTLGPDHPNTLASRNNLAISYQAAGDPGRAIPLLEETLALRERLFGIDHPETLETKSALRRVKASKGSSTNGGES
ncbi:tetratricopeptide repeat protein [Streptomyces sp. S1D4-11]